MTTLIADVETDGFLPSMTRLWTIQLGDSETEEATVYADQPGFPPLREAVDRMQNAETLVFHNGMGFDIHAVNKIFPEAIQPHQIFDTLIAARLLWPHTKEHSLRAWGERTGTFKGEYSGDFQTFDDELVEYARQDVVTTRALYKRIQSRREKWDYEFALWLENLFAFIISLQVQNGFTLDVPKAVDLEATLRQELADIGLELQEVFPPRWVPRAKTVNGAYRAGERKPLSWVGITRKRDNPEIWDRLKDEPKQPIPYTAVELEVFNPSSRQQVAQRLIQKYGWRPSKFTEGGQPEVSEEVLNALPYPEAKKFARYLEVEKQLSQIISKDGTKGWLVEVDEKTKRVHGSVNTLGASTGRCSHFYPNMAQINKKDLRMRGVWIPRPGWKLVGADADGLEFCCLGHYVQPYDDGLTIRRVVEGDKSKGTDIHSANRDAVLAELKQYVQFPEPTKDILKKLRENAKTLVYALIYGAQEPKLGMTVSEMLDTLGSKRKAKEKQMGSWAREAVGKGIPGLDKLIDRVKAKAKKQGWIKAIDGRKIYIKSQHSAFNFLLQGAGAIIMKMALVIFHFEKVVPAGFVHGRDFGYCANVHDEVQMECPPEHAETLGQMFVDSIHEAGERLGFRCPLSASYDVGDSWAETH